MRVALVLIAALLAFTGTAQAAGPTLGADGETAAVYDYASAIRERVFIPQPGIDQDHDNANDRIAVDVIRPNAAGPFPAIVLPSPYFTSLCRGLMHECMGDPSGDGVNDLWPLFLDNYFVPRGYAVVLAQMNGTGYNTDGCPHHGGPGDVAGEKSVIDWLNGRTGAVDKNGVAKVASWHNGSSAMLGKSYDGTLANGVAATGVAGLKTIVPISAISDWYDYSRTGGIRTVGTDYPSFLNNAIMEPSVLGAPDRRSACTTVNNGFKTIDGDETGDRNAFWDDRDYAKNVSHVTAAVFAVHGFQDDNVTMSQLWPWWNGLEATGVPRKLWLLRSGHTDPFDSRRAAWVDTLHRWFDRWLYDVHNGIETEPRVTIEDSKDVWGQYADWPVPGTSDVDVFLRGTAPAQAGDLRGRAGAAGDSVSFTNTATAAGNTLPSNLETTHMNAPTGAQANRRVFLSRPLANDLRLSGRAVLDLDAALSTTQSNLGVILVDYNATAFDEVTRNNEGISAPAGPCTDWGASTQYDKACYSEVTKPFQSVTQWRVTHGILDSSNRSSLTTAEAATPGQPYAFTIPTEPTEHTFAAGHQIGVIVVGNLLGVAGTPSGQITVDTQLSKLVLPVAGGDQAAQASGLTDETAPTATCPADAAWHADNVDIACTAADAGSGVAGGAPFTLRTAVAAGAVNAHATAERSVCDRAGNCVTAGAERKIDRRPPDVTLTPPATSEFARGAVVTFGHACSDDGSGIASCTAPARLDTATAGPHQLVVTGRDAAGNEQTATWSYRVLGSLPKLRVKAKSGTRVALTSGLGASVRLTGAHTTLRVKLTAGVTRLVTLPKRFRHARTLSLTLVTTSGALKRTDHVTLRLKH